jgi:hypothetical protein
MPVDFQPDVDESSIDFQPVEEAPVPPPTKPRFSAVGFAPSEFGFSQEPSEAELSGASEFLQKPLLNVSPERGRKMLETVYPPLRLIKHLPGGQQFEQGLSQSAAEQVSGMTAPAGAQYLIPFYGPAALAVGGAEAIGAGAGGLTEAVRQGDIAGAGRNIMNIAGGAAGVLPLAHTAFRSEALAGKPPPEQPIPESEVQNAVHGETETPVRNVQQPVGAKEGASEVPANAPSEEAGARGGPISEPKEVPTTTEVLGKEAIPSEEAKGQEKEGVLNQPAAEPTAVPPLPKQFEGKSVAEAAQSISEIPLAETTAYQGRFGGALTGMAYELGSRAKTPADVAALKQAALSFSEQGRAAMKAGDFSKASDLIMRGQLANEAHQAATGVNIKGQPQAVDIIKQRWSPDYEPPLPDPAYKSKAGREPANPAAPEPAKPELLKTLEAAANRARQRIDTRGPAKFGTGPDPVDLARNIADWGAIGAYRLAEAGYDVAKWSANMVKEFGEAIKPHLKAVYQQARQGLSQASQQIESQRSVIGKILGPESEPTPEIKPSKTTAYPKKQAQITVGETTALREVLKKAEAAGAAGVEAGKTAEATRLAPILGALRDKLADSITKAQALGEHLRGQEKGAAIGGAAAREDAARIDRWLAADTENIKDSLNQLVKTLPVAERGRFTSAITSALKRPPLFSATAVETMYRNAAKVAARIEDRVSQVARNDLTQKIESFSKAAKSPGIDVNYRKQIRSELDNFARLKKGNGLSDDALQAFHDRLVSLRDIGKSEQTTKAALWQWQKEFAERELKDQPTRPLETRPELRPLPGDKMTTSMRIRNWIRRAQNTSAIVDKALLPIDAMFDLMESAKGTYKGWLFRQARGPTDLAWNKAVIRRNGLLQPFEQFVKDNKLTPENSNRIGVYAEAAQEGGRKRLIDSGLSPQTIDRIVKSITPTELQAYRLMRQAMDSQLPGVTELMRKLYNTEVKPVVNYFPMARDWRVFEDKPVGAKEPGAEAGYDELATWKALLGDYGPRDTTATRKGFTIAREPGAKTPIRTDAFDIFRQHIQDVSYLQEMQPELKRLGELARGDLFRQKYGDVGQKIFIDWLDTLARQGGVENFKRIRWLDTLRKNTSVGIIGFRLSSQLVHESQIPLIVARIGKFFGNGMLESFTDRGKEFIRQNFAETMERSGGEPAQAESEKAGVSIGGVRLVSPKVARASYALARSLDSVNSQAAALGTYLKLLKDKGADWQRYDELPVDKEAQAQALVVARRAIASPLPKDVPQALSRGALTGGNVSVGRTLFQFNNIFLDQWSNMRHDFWQAGIREKNPKVAAAMFLGILGSIALETGIKTATKQATQAVTGYTPKKPQEDEFTKKAVAELGRRFPFGGPLETQLLYGETGIPSLDAVMGVTKSLKTAVTSTKPNVAARAAIRTVGGASQLLGVPGAAQASELLEKSIP